MTDSKKRGSAKDGTAKKAKGTNTRWTVMCYLAGDNNLSTDMAYTVDQIKAVADHNKHVDLFVYFDGFSRNVPTLYCDFSDQAKEVMYYRSAGIKDKLIKGARKNKNVFNENSASMNNIINFVNWCVSKDKVKTGTKVVDRRKNKKYALIISGHSFGFSNWALFKDENADYHMTLSKLRWLFQRISLTGSDLVAMEKERLRKRGRRPDRSSWSFKERTAEILGKPLDLLGFDSCEMSKIEIGGEFADLAKTLVASEGSVPNAGWNYAQILLDRLRTPERSNELKVAAGFVESFIRQQNKFAIADLSVDMTAWDLAKLPALEKAVGKLAENLIASLDRKNPLVLHPMKRVLSYVHWTSQTYSFEQNVDLGDLCTQLIRELSLLKLEVDPKKWQPFQKVIDACDAVMAALRNCVLLCGFSGSDFQYSKGISIFFPWSWECYLSTEIDYGNLRFIENQETGAKWDEFLRWYLGPVTWRSSNRLTPADTSGAYVLDPDNPSVVYESYSFVDHGRIDDGRWLDGEKRPPDGPKRPPDGPKRPPDGPKRPPDGPKGLSSGISSGNMSTFLSRFMRMKNVGTYWNRTGFASSRVTFNGQGATTPTHRGVSGRNTPVTDVKVPVATSIQKILGLMEASVANGIGTSPGDADLLNGFRNLLLDASHRAGEAESIAAALLNPKFAGRFETGRRKITNLEKFLSNAVKKLGVEEVSSGWKNELTAIKSRQNGAPRKRRR